MLDLLVKYARDRGLEAEQGFKPKTVRWAIVCDAKGRFLNVQRLGPEDQASRGRNFGKCPDLSQSEMVSAGSRHFLVDRADVVTLFGVEADDEKALAKHSAFVGLLKQASHSLPDLALLAASLEDTRVLAAIRAKLVESKAKRIDNVTLAIDERDPPFLVDDPAWHDWWRGFRLAITKGKRRGDVAVAVELMRCFASGDLVAPSTTHPKITGLSDVGGHSAGDVLVSFDKSAFGSYGLAQSANAAVSEQMAAAYRAALNDLLKKGRSRRLAGAKVIHWYAGRASAVEATPEKDPIEVAFSGALELPDEEETDIDVEERVARDRAQAFLDALRTGELKDLLDCRYYSATLSGNAGRVVVRDWMEGQFGDLAESVTTWFEDLSIVRRDGGALARSPKFMAVVGGLARDLRDVPAPLIARLWHAAVRGEPIPRQALVMAITRAKLDVLTDKTSNHARMGLIKAHLIRDNQRNEERIPMDPYLSHEHPDPAYHCGRLMAILADLQRAALGDVGAGVIERYYAAASATPSLLLGRLVRTAQHHLAKVRGDRAGLAYWFDAAIAEVLGQIPPRAMPETLDLRRQSLFALGYYQQKATRRSREQSEESAQ